MAWCKHVVDQTLDTGVRTFNDVRGLAIVTGGIQDTVGEDAATLLTAAGAISLVAEYRGSADFVAQTIAGTNGYGTFTLAADGTWTYAALNAQTDIQALDVGETTDGVETAVTVTIEGRTDANPVFVGNTTLVMGSAGNQVTAASVLDVLALFTNDNNPFSFGGMTTTGPFAANLGAGTVTFADFTNVFQAGDYAVELLMENDDTSGSVTQTVTIAVGMNHDFGDDYDGSVLPNLSTINASSARDIAIFGEDATNLSLNTFAGDDVVTFGSFAADDYLWRLHWTQWWIHHREWRSWGRQDHHWNHWVRRGLFRRWW